MLEHGGRLLEASARTGRPLEQWLDLSTGIAPFSPPLPVIPARCWQRLPEDFDGLEASACAYYGVERVLPVAGSQAAIQLLPEYFSPCRVGFLEPAYAEHRHAWQRSGHETITVTAETLEAQLDTLSVLVLINPNNPTGQRWLVADLLRWHQRLQARGGYLIVDEAFMDATPEGSVLPWAGQAGVVVLRSLGKFFALAGARVGFVMAEPAIHQFLQQQLGPWTVAGPSRWVAQAALNDRRWQHRQRQRIRAAGQRLARLLSAHGRMPSGGTALFQWYPHPCAERDVAHFMAQGILPRYFAASGSVRLGLPAQRADWQRLAQALAGLESREQ